MIANYGGINLLLLFTDCKINLEIIGIANLRVFHISVVLKSADLAGSFCSFFEVKIKVLTRAKTENLIAEDDISSPFM